MFGKSAFGTGGGFGQQQQQQPANTGFGQQNTQQTGFGGFGATPSTTSAFGQPAQQTSAFGSGLNAPATGGFGATNTTSAFGQPKPTGFGAAAPSAFGSTSATNNATGFGATNAFGAANNTTSAFGATQQQPSGGLFGQQRPQQTGGAFGSSFGQQQQTTGFGAPAAAGAFGNQQQQGGTAQADFAPTQDRDITTGVNHFFQTITAMPQYKNFSLEELRLQDYAQNRKNAGAAGASGSGAFGGATTGTFGQQQQTTTGAFGNTGSAFGTNNNTGSAFGTGGTFGQTGQTTSAFGQPATTGGAFGQPATGSTSLFGQTSGATTGGAFGASNNTGGAFGQPAATGAFGQPAATGGAFGNTASKPFGGFGTNTATTGAFGQPATTGAFGQPAAAATTGAFGQPAATGGAFGQPAAATGFGSRPAVATTGAFGQPATTGAFGQPATTGAFGQPATTGAFGQPAATGGAFGATAATANKPGFSFGTSNTTTPAAGGLGFGAGTGGFGQQPAAGGFGQPAAATGGLFGNNAGAAKPATGGLFGAGATTTGFGATGGFGQTGQQATTGLGGGLNTGGLNFGQKPTLGGTGGFGTLGGGLNQQQQQQTTLGGGGFGMLGGATGGLGMGQQQGSYNLPTQGGLTSFGTNNLANGMIATVDNNTYGNNPLFDLSANKNNSALLNNNNNNNTREATAVAVSGYERHKKTSSHFPASPRVVSRIKLRGFTFPSSNGNTSGAATNVNTSMAKNASAEQDAMLGAQAFRSSKPLLFDGNETQNVAQTLAQTSRKKVTFNPELEHGSFTSSPSPLFTSSPRASPLNGSSIAPPVAPTSEDNTAVVAAEAQGYSMSPSYSQLVNMSKDQLRSISLTVSRRGFGCIIFDQPVDLSDVPLSRIMGDLIIIQNKSIVVYPDQNTKPPEGQQLNIPATITLENCFTTDKQTGATLTDPTHPRVVAFIKKLHDRPNIEFVSYDAVSTKWTFKVKSF